MLAREYGADPPALRVVALPKDGVLERNEVWERQTIVIGPDGNVKNIYTWDVTIQVAQLEADVAPRESGRGDLELATPRPLPLVWGRRVRRVPVMTEAVAPNHRRASIERGAPMVYRSADRARVRRKAARRTGDTTGEIDGAEVAGVNEQGIVEDDATVGVPQVHLEGQADTFGETILADVFSHMTSNGIEDAGGDLVAEVGRSRP